MEDPRDIRADLVGCSLPKEEAYSMYMTVATAYALTDAPREELEPVLMT
jgi:hypothetical protein